MRQQTAQASARRAKAQALRRQEILEAAARVFGEKGYHGSSMRDIADVLSVRQAAIYYYYASKDSILEEICRLGITEYVEGLRPVAGSPGAFADKLRAGIALHLTPLLARRFYVSTFLYSRHLLPPDMRRPVDRLAREYEELWRRMISDGIEGGSVARHVDPGLAAFALLGSLNAVARRPRIVRGNSVKEATERFARLFEAGLLAT
jgi:TetR/AcrR family transcriptional regulator, cholesterol catabolism regulator